MAQSALFYVKDAYDKERFERLRDISAEMMALKTDLPIETVKNLYCSDFSILVKRIRFLHLRTSVLGCFYVQNII